MRSVSLTPHVLASRVTKQTVKCIKGRGRKRVCSSNLLRFRMPFLCHKRSQTYIDQNFAKKLVISSMYSLHHWISIMKTARTYPRYQTLARIHNCGSDAAGRPKKAKARRENPKSVNWLEFSGLEIESDLSGSNLTRRSSKNHYHPVPWTDSVEWSIMETSMEDNLMGRAAVIPDEQYCRPKMPAEALDIHERVVERNSCCEILRPCVSGQEEASSTKNLPDRMEKHESCRCICDAGSAGQCLITNQFDISSPTRLTKLSSSVEDILRSEFCEQGIGKATASMSLKVCEAAFKKLLNDDHSDVKPLTRTRRRSESFPPPLASMARKSYAQFPPQLPSLQLQPIRSKGRILLHEVKTPPQPLFQPIRANGRLVLQLINRYDNENLRPIGPKEQVLVEGLTAASEQKFVHHKPDAALSQSEGEPSIDIVNTRKSSVSAFSN